MESNVMVSELWHISSSGANDVVGCGPVSSGCDGMEPVRRCGRMEPIVDGWSL